MIAARFIVSHDSISFTPEAPSSQKTHHISVSHLAQTMTKLGRVEYSSYDTATLR